MLLRRMCPKMPREINEVGEQFQAYRQGWTAGLVFSVSRERICSTHAS